MTPVKTLDHTDSDKAKICMKSSMKDNFYLPKKKPKKKTLKKQTTMYLITVLEYL